MNAPPSRFSIRALSLNDDAHIRRVVEVHRASFPGFFMTRLGPKFLFEYYRTVIGFSGGLCVVAGEGDAPVAGFVAGFLNPEQFYSVLRRRQLRLGIAMLPALATHPGLLGGVLFNRNKAAGMATGRAAGAQAGEAELSSVGVLPQVAGKGVGAALVAHFCAAMRARGASHVVLTTDTEENDRVIGFYQRLGFRDEGRLPASEGRTMIRFVRRLEGSGSLDNATVRS
jgi:ribosomal protein S18 acetylase RimI-like enzyme